MFTAHQLLEHHVTYMFIWFELTMIFFKKNSSICNYNINQLTHTRLGKFCGHVQGERLGECGWKTLAVLLTHDIIHIDSYSSNHISRAIGPCYFHVMNKKLLVFHKDSYSSNNSLFHKLVPKEWPCYVHHVATHCINVIGYQHCCVCEGFL
jgi:hypothetical protein